MRINEMAFEIHKNAVQMSWYSDHEVCDERDPDWCERSGCAGGDSKEKCDRCMRMHTAQEEEEEENEYC